MAKKRDPTENPYEITSQYRNFTCLLYLDSCKKNWQQILADYHIATAISPLHDRDIKEDGTIKKPHYHIVVNFTQKTSIGRFIHIVKSIGGKENTPEHYEEYVISDNRGMLRYLCHLDEKDPMKPLYDIEDVITYGPMNYEKKIKMDKSEEEETMLLMEMTLYIHKNHITNFAEFQCLNAEEGREDWFIETAKKATYYIATVIKTEGYLS